jgi:hypothetical protein
MIFIDSLKSAGVLSLFKFSVIFGFHNDAEKNDRFKLDLGDGPLRFNDHFVGSLLTLSLFSSLFLRFRHAVSAKDKQAPPLNRCTIISELDFHFLLQN